MCKIQDLLALSLLAALAAGCLAGSMVEAPDRLTADEVPTQVKRSRTGDFFVDPATELGWSTRVSVPMRYSETRAYCESLGKEWRLPTIGELETTMQGVGDARTMKPEWKKGLSDGDLLFSGEEIPVIDDDKQPFVMSVANGQSFNGNGREGYVLCVHGPVSRQRRPVAEPPAAQVGVRWWETTDACPAGAIARGSVGLAISCKGSEGQRHGRTTLWEQGKRSEKNYLDDKRDGPTVSWRADGTKIAESNYREDKLDGKTVTWRADGGKASESNYLGGKLHGKTMSWRADGTSTAESDYRDGKLHGTTVSWRVDGGKSSESNYRDGKLHGSSVSWRADGTKLSESNYRDGKLYGVKVSWRVDGAKASEANYRDDKLHGKSASWRADGGKVSEMSYRDGKLHGRSSNWRENGTKSSESDYADGLLSGSQQQWDEKGRLVRRTRYNKGRVIQLQIFDLGKPRDGLVEQKHANGVASYIGRFKKGHPIGKHYGYYENGKPHFESNYSPKGIPNGRSVSWHASGRPREVSRFVDGALHGERVVYDDLGKPSERLRYDQGVALKK